ncbi:hypothetical protein ONZ45_g5766 [Pleurotus djamor]|nr:hypothetical protein ONZ45_g5766 [Pleurotus djamor]
MVLQVVLSAASALYSSHYFVHIIAGFTAVYVLHAFAQGKRTSRERDLHARTIIITGAFTPIGLTLAQNLAQRGAHLILLTPQPIDSGEPAIFIPLLRSTTLNEEIYAEQCDLSSPSSIRSFCSKFLAGKTNRLDGLIFAHEYQHIGPASLFSTRLEDGERARRERESASLATFLCITLLLPSLLVAPVERDIRIINVVNPFYAAAAAGTAPIDPSPSTTPTSTPITSLLLSEGLRSLRTCLLARHLQRILDALPAAQLPKTDDAGAGPSAIPVASAKAQKSNIVVVSVSPGISRAGTIMHLLNADWVNPSKSKLGVFCYILLQPILRIFAKSTNSAIQTILHALFLPTPFKTVGTPGTSSQLLKPGALYSDCSVVPLVVRPERFVSPETEETSTPSTDNGTGENPTPQGEGEAVRLEDDGEYGGEVAGRLVWEGYERALKAWEKANPAKEEEKQTAPDVDVDSLPAL